ncbi:hypothetical protein [Microbacterium luticocti]|uniref:PIN-like domain-containing protein n=1 Tax=Microbacterium luticocti TaxID=451764 RepID=UPI0012EBA3CF|nr:hypothetical protein [Microbacterium luticocti]
MSSAFSPVYFTDENALGLGKLLRRSGRDDIVYPGHEDLPEVPLGARDVEWMQVAGARGFIVLTRDRRIRTRPAELAAYREFGVCSVWIGAKRDLRAQDQVELFLKHEDRIRRAAAQLGAGPWALVLGLSGLRQIALREG